MLNKLKEKLLNTDKPNVVRPTKNRKAEVISTDPIATYNEQKAQGKRISANTAMSVGDALRDMGKLETAAERYIEAAQAANADEQWTITSILIGKGKIGRLKQMGFELKPGQKMALAKIRLQLAVEDGGTQADIEGVVSELASLLRPQDAHDIEEIVRVIDRGDVSPELEIVLTNMLIKMGRSAQAVDRLRRAENRALRDGKGEEAAQFRVAIRNSGLEEIAPIKRVDLDLDVVPASGVGVRGSGLNLPTLPVLTPSGRGDESMVHGKSGQEDGLPPLALPPLALPEPSTPRRSSGQIAIGIDVPVLIVPPPMDAHTALPLVPGIVFPEERSAQPGGLGSEVVIRAAPAVPPVGAKEVRQDGGDLEFPEISPEISRETGGDALDKAALLENLERQLLDGSDESLRIIMAPNLADVSGDEAEDEAAMIGALIAALREGIDPEDAETQYEMGVAFLQMGLFREALTNFQKALRRPEYRFTALEGIAEAFISSGQPRLAIRMINEVSSHLVDKHNRVGGLYWKARAEEAMGHKQEAIALYEEIVMLDRTVHDAEDRLADLDSHL